MTGKFGDAIITSMRFEPVFVRDAKRIENDILQEYKNRNPIRSENRSILRVRTYKLFSYLFEIISKLINLMKRN